jgi:hypothetical protein
MATQQSYINNPNPLLAKAYLTNLNLNHFKMIEARGLKLMHRGLVEWHHLPTNFHENLPVGSKDRHTFFMSEIKFSDEPSSTQNLTGPWDNECSLQGIVNVAQLTACSLSALSGI